MRHPPTAMSPEPTAHGSEAARAAWPWLQGRGFWTCWAALAVVTLALSIGARVTTAYPGDVRLARALQSLDVPVVGGLLRLENTLGSPLPATAIIVALSVTLLLMQQWRLAVAFAGTNALRGVGSLVKALVDRPRPDGSLVQVTAHAAGASFPSGHVFSAVLLYGSLALLLEFTALPPLLRRGLQGLCFGVILLMGPARVYVGAHWPSDVLGGYLWGSLLLLLVLRVATGAGWLPTHTRAERPAR